MDTVPSPALSIFIYLFIYSSLIQQLPSSMAIVKETARRQCTAALLHSSPPSPSLSFFLPCDIRDCLTPLHHSHCAKSRHLLGYYCTACARCVQPPMCTLERERGGGGGGSFSTGGAGCGLEDAFGPASVGGGDQRCDWFLITHPGLNPPAGELLGPAATDL